MHINRSVRRMTTALAAATGLIVLAATPASAATLGGEIKSGIIELTDSEDGSLELIDLAPEEEGCGTADVDGTIDADDFAFSLSSTGEIQVGVGTFVAVLTGSGGGTVTGTSLAGSGSFEADIYDSEGDCVAGDEVCLDLGATVTISGTYSGSGSPASPVVGADLILTLTTDPPGLDSFSYCEAPFTTYFGGSATITGSAPLVIDITSVT